MKNFVFSTGCKPYSAGRLSFFLILIVSTVARSPIGYDAVVVLVGIELFFAFAVGLSCILFSLNMFRALNRSPEVYRSLPIGDFPLPLPGCSNIQADRGRSRLRAESNLDLSEGEILAPEVDYCGNVVNSKAPSRVQSEYDIENYFDDDKPDEKAESGTEGSGILPPLRSFATYLRLW